MFEKMKSSWEDIKEHDPMGAFVIKGLAVVMVLSGASELANAVQQDSTKDISPPPKVSTLHPGHSPEKPAPSETRPALQPGLDIHCESNDLVIFDVTKHGDMMRITSSVRNNSPFCIEPTFPPKSTAELEAEDGAYLMQRIQEAFSNAPPPESQPPHQS